MTKVRLPNSTSLPKALWLLLWVLAVFAQPANTTSPTGTTAPPLPTQVAYKQAELVSSDRYLFEVEVMILALEKTLEDDGPYELQPIHPMNRARNLLALSQDTYPNLVMLLSYEDSLLDDGNLIYIPIPLDRGIFSYRLCFMRDEIKPRMQGIKTLKQLKGFHFGSGVGWADTKILRHNGLTTLEADTLLSLFRMTKAGRIDLFCRGVGEYYSELTQQGQTIDLSADDEITLYYPLPKFLFAHKNSKALMDRIQRGLKRALDDGSFDQLWKHEHEQHLQQAHLKTRRLIILENPLIRKLPPDYQRYDINPMENPP